MAKYIVKNVKCELSALGLCADTVNAEIELAAETGKSWFLSASEYEGFVNIFKTKKSVLNNLLYEGADSEEEYDKLSSEERCEKGEKFFCELNEKCSVYEGEGYAEFYADKKCGGRLHDAIRLLIYVTRANWEEIEQAKTEFVGKAINEIKILKCDAERAWEQGCEIYELED